MNLAAKIDIKTFSDDRRAAAWWNSSRLRPMVLTCSHNGREASGEAMFALKRTNEITWEHHWNGAAAEHTKGEAHRLWLPTGICPENVSSKDI